LDSFRKCELEAFEAAAGCVSINPRNYQWEELALRGDPVVA
jgi:hypothetical protein